MDLKNKLRGLKDKFNSLNEDSLKLQQEGQMLNQAATQNERERVEVNAQIKLVEELLGTEKVYNNDDFVKDDVAACGDKNCDTKAKTLKEKK